MIIKIICAGTDSFSRLYQPDPEEKLIGVDGGMNVLIAMGLRADIALGDFDSSDYETIRYHCDAIRVLPKEKDLGDLELAVLEVINQDFEKMIIYNVTGGRLDHFYAALNIVAKYGEKHIEIQDDYNRIYAVKDSYVILKSEFRYCSFYALEDRTLITLKGFKYPLLNYSLKRFDNLCLSNEIVDEASIETNGRKVLVMETNEYKYPDNHI